MAVVRALASPNFDARPADVPVDILVIHYTGMRDADAALARLTDVASRVSAHYLIDEAGETFRLVSEDNRAWHAGVALWRGASDVNARSIGIELVNPGHEFGYCTFPEAQMAALERLAGDIVRRNAIPARNVVGHSDVAPARKTDPGELFDWRRLAAAGIGLWPEPDTTLDSATPADEPAVPGLLGEYGYDIADPTAAIVAFQRHFARHRLDGVADAATRRTLAALVALTRV